MSSSRPTKNWLQNDPDRTIIFSLGNFYIYQMKNPFGECYSLFIGHKTCPTESHACCDETDNYVRCGKCGAHTTLKRSVILKDALNFMYDSFHR